MKATILKKNRVIHTHRCLLLLVAWFTLQGTVVLAQVPCSFSYQTVVHRTSGELLADQEISLRFSIIQGGAFGTHIYVETHKAITNQYGLASLAIGQGTIINGNFSSIDWGADTYFLKVELDASGGESFTDMGTTRILSVPYALYARSADTLSGNITENQISNMKNYLTSESDPVYTESAAKSIIDAGSGAVITTTERNKLDGIKTWSVGDFAHGGIVFWVDETGTRGLVCVKKDQRIDVKWMPGAVSSELTRAIGDGLFAGRMNTPIIVTVYVAFGGDATEYAASICHELQITEDDNTFGDWYLPSLVELRLMYDKRESINKTASENGGDNFDASYYWSSTEINSANARAVNFENGTIGYAGKASLFRVRAIRAF